MKDLNKKLARVFGTEEGMEVLKWLESTYCGTLYSKQKPDGKLPTQPYDLFYRTGARDVVKDIKKRIDNLR